MPLPRTAGRRTAAMLAFLRADGNASPRAAPRNCCFTTSLSGLSRDQLVEIQALYWVGEDHTPARRARRAMRHYLEYSGKNDDRMPGYLVGKYYLAPSLERALGVLGRGPEPVHGRVRPDGK